MQIKTIIPFLSILLFLNCSNNPQENDSIEEINKEEALEGEDSSDPNDIKSEELLNKNKTNVLYLRSDSDLPTCGESIVEQIYYISESKTLKACQEGSWVLVDLGGHTTKGDKGSSGAKGNDGAKGEPGAKGDPGTPAEIGSTEGKIVVLDSSNKLPISVIPNIPNSLITEETTLTSIEQSNALAGQYLRWNGTTWSPQYPNTHSGGNILTSLDIAADGCSTANKVVLDGSPDLSGVALEDVFVDTAGNRFVITSFNDAEDEISFTGTCTDDTATTSSVYRNGLVIKSGAVGIGIQTPQADLHLKRSGDIAMILEKNGGNNYNYFRFRNDDVDQWAVGLDNGFNYSISAYNDTPKQWLTIEKSTGNIGVDDTTPGAKLHVNGTFKVEGTAGSFDIDGTGSWMTFSRDAANYIAAPGTSASLYFLTGGSDSATKTRMIIKSDGKIGINTLDPQGDLDVNGAIYQRGSSLHADYVFEKDYELETIDEHSEFMWKNKHLPAVPKAKKDASGLDIVNVGQQRRGILEELEKAHVYIDQLKGEIEALKSLVCLDHPESTICSSN